MEREQEDILKRMPKSWLLLREIYLRNLKLEEQRKGVDNED